LLDSLKQWLEETLGKLSRKSDTALAVRYALGRWEALLRYCDNGRLEIDNNAALRGGASLARCRARKKKTFFSPARMVVEKTQRRCTAGTAPRECRGRSCRPLTPRCLIDPICCQYGRVQPSPVA